MGHEQHSGHEHHEHGRTGEGEKLALGLAGGLALGAGAMYILDPDQGRRRRSLASDKLARLRRVTADSADATVRDASNRIQGIRATLGSRRAAGEAPDDVVTARVRSRLGRVVSHPRSVDVTTIDGRVQLSGHILKDEVERLLIEVAAVPGVRGIENNLEEHAQRGDLPELQGGIPREGYKPDYLQARWSPATRVVAGSLGASLLAMASSLRGLAGGLLGLTGAALVLRAVTNLEFSRLTGIGAGRKAVDVDKDINVDVPTDRAYEFWSDLEHFPMFMERVKEVRRIDDERSFWRVTGPLGLPASFTAEITEKVAGEKISWKTLPGSALQHAGTVRFDPAGHGRTRINLHFAYNPPGGAIGHGLSALLGGDPKRVLDDDMVRLKSLLEEGKTTVAGREVILQG